MVLIKTVRQKIKNFICLSFIKKNSRGFTLAEIMVVIAIISTLTGIILLALVSVRNNMKDGNIKNNLVRLQNLAELIYLDTGNYEGIVGCSPGLDCIGICDPRTKELCLELRRDTDVNFDIDYRSGRYCAFGGLPSKGIDPRYGVPNVYFCVDSQGRTAEGDVFQIVGTCYRDIRCP